MALIHCIFQVPLPIVVLSHKAPIFLVSQSCSLISLVPFSPPSPPLENCPLCPRNLRFSAIMSAELSVLEDGTKLQRRPVVLSGAALVFMCFQTLGVIYSDIGTS